MGQQPQQQYVPVPRQPSYGHLPPQQAIYAQPPPQSAQFYSPQQNQQQPMNTNWNVNPQQMQNFQMGAPKIVDDSSNNAQSANAQTNTNAKGKDGDCSLM